MAQALNPSTREKESIPQYLNHNMKSWSYLRLVKGSIEKKLLFPVQNNESHPNLSLREYPGSSAESMLE